MEKPEDRGDGSRILVIDDEEVIHVSLSRILGRQGHEVVGVLSAREGLEEIAGGEFDLIVTDLMMPGMDGIQLLDRLKSEGCSTPVLMITGYPSIKTALQALRMGAVDYIAKPFTRRELLGPINRTLRQGTEPQLDEPAETGVPEEADGYAVPDLDLSPGDRVCLRKHSWAVFRQDGTMQVGIEQSFLENIGSIQEIETPDENDLVEQGFVGIRIRTDQAEEHSVFMPLSGQVVEVNRDALSEPSAIGSGIWLIRILPGRLEAELQVLVKR
jgi:DNA-binding response OmpR family regulator